MYRIEVFDVRRASSNWRGIVLSDEGDEEGFMYAFDDHSPAHCDDLRDAVDLVNALHIELGVRAGVRHAGSGRFLYDSEPARAAALSFEPI